MLTSKLIYLISIFVMHAISFSDFFPLNVSTALEYICIGHRFIKVP